MIEISVVVEMFNVGVESDVTADEALGSLGAQDYPPEQVKTLLRGVLNKITLTRSRTGDVSACLGYEIPIEGRDKVASPSRTELSRPTLTARRILRLTRRERRAA